MACPAAIKEYASAYLMVDSDARIRLPHRSLTISIDVIRLQNADDGHQQDADIEPQ